MKKALDGRGLIRAAVAARARYRRGPGPVEASGPEERPEGQDALAAVAAPALPRSLHPACHQNLVGGFHGTRSDSVARFGGVRVFHAAAVAAEVGQLPPDVAGSPALPMGHISRPTRLLVRAIVALMDGPVSIPHALSSTEGIKRLSRIPARPDVSRAEIGRRVCDAFGFLDLNGRPQVTSCLSALRRLERAGGIALPEPAGLPASAGAVRDPGPVRVDGPALRPVFNGLMASEHPRSARLHVGRRLRYLVGASHGWLGGLLFAPATRVLAARDAWLGWDDASRGRHLDRVIGAS